MKSFKSITSINISFRNLTTIHSIHRVYTKFSNRRMTNFIWSFIYFFCNRCCFNIRSNSKCIIYIIARSTIIFSPLHNSLNLRVFFFYFSTFFSFSNIKFIIFRKISFLNKIFTTINSLNTTIFCSCMSNILC